MLVFLLSILLISFSFSFSSHLTINVTERYHTFEPNSGRVVQVVEGKMGQSLMATPVYVDEDEVVVTTVRNRMYSKSLTIHHHGLHQHGTPWMDGVPGLSQTLIAPGSTKIYQFIAHPAGTHFYHTHVAQLGLRGPFIVRAKEDPHRALYDTDENVLFISDLSKSRDESVWLAGLISGALTSNEDPESDLSWEDTVLLINGIVSNQATVSIKDSNARPRLRIINGAFNWGIELSIENHVFVVIATDGKNCNPRSTSILVLSPGERYDVVLMRVNEKGPIDDSKGYAIQLATRNGHQATARLQYSIPPSTSSTSSTSSTVWQPTKNHLKKLDLSYNVSLLSAHATTTPLMPSSTSRTIQMKLGGDMMTYKWTINNVAWSLDDLDIRTPLSILQGVFTTQIKNAIQQVDLNEIVDIELTNPTGMQHPFHLHGHKFWVIGSRAILETGSSLLQPQDHPTFKDTINIPPQYVVTLRVQFDNPGPWLFHCHTSFHLNRGMAVVFMVGNSEDQPVPPPGVDDGSFNSEDDMHTSMTTYIYLCSILFLLVGAVSGYAISRMTTNRRPCFKGYSAVVELQTIPTVAD